MRLESDQSSCQRIYIFPGRTCEEKMEQCEDNPCLNDALCLIEEDVFRCYCVPDYHGTRCQFRYDECRLPPGPKCLHGGVCVDEVDGFECQCGDGFTGNHCQCSGAEEEMTCLDVNSTLSWTIPPDYLPDDDESNAETPTTEEGGYHVTADIGEIDHTLSTPAAHVPEGKNVVTFILYFYL